LTLVIIVYSYFNSSIMKSDERGWRWRGVQEKAYSSASSIRMASGRVVSNMLQSMLHLQ